MPFAALVHGRGPLGRAGAEALEIARLQNAARLQSAILDVLAARGIALSAEARGRITECTDTKSLQRWIVRAAVALREDDLWRA